jgi:glycerol-3-phosphate acyltransferase PlsX
MRIAVDAMGGDAGPGVIVEGALDALRNGRKDIEVVLVGCESTLQEELKARSANALPITAIHADEVISMSDAPTESLRRKPTSSIAVGLALHKERKAQAFVSTGNTGAVVANALLSLGRLRNVRRPAIATYLPTEAGGCVLLDVGANATVKAQNLVEFGQMGAVYARHILKRENPRVGLLNIGEEETKGNEVAQEAHRLLKASHLNFIGNVEGRGVIRGDVDVVVCDGFVGNILLKFVESVFGMVKSTVKKQIARDPRVQLGALLMKPVLEEFREKLNYEEYGGAPLLGVNGVCIICHGSSSSRAICNAVRVAGEFVRSGLNDEIDREIAIEREGAR